jgi:hypothetical protein
MDDAERQRTMDFILQQQAQLAASMQKNEEESLKRNQRDTRRDVSIAQIRRLLARTIWERRRDRRDWNARMAALANAQMRSDQAGARLEESMAALIDAQIRSEDAQVKSEEAQVRADERIAALADAQSNSEKKHDRSEEWRTQIEESFARSNERLAYLEDLTARNSEAIAKLTESNDRNSEAIAKLTEVVTDMARRRNGGEESA